MKIIKKIPKLLAIILVLLATTLLDAKAQLNKSYFYTRGREYIVEGKYRQAIESLNILLRSHPDQEEGYFLRGVAKYNLNDLHGSMRDFSLVLEKNEVYTLAYQYRGIVRSRLGLYDEALQDFKAAIEMRPNFAGSYYSRAVTLFLNQQFDAAIKDYDTFIRLEPLSVDGYVNRGNAKLYIKDTVAAMKDFNRAIQVNPYHDDGFLRRGVLLLAQGETEKGINDINTALKIDSTTAIGYFYRGMGHNTLGNIELALNDFDRAIEHDPTNSVAIFNRAILRSQIGDYNRAIEDYELVVNQNPQNVLVYYNRAAVYAQIGEFHKAIADYSKAIEIYGDFANAYLYRSSLKATLGDKKGYAADKKKAEQLIQEYRNTLHKEGDSAFADTSARFSSIINFNADFDDQNLSRLNSRTLNKYRPLPMYRITMMSKKDSILTHDPTAFHNEEYRIAMLELGDENLALTYKQSDLQNWQLMEKEIKYSSNTQSNNLSQNLISEVFNLGVLNTLMRQYSTAMDYYSFLISEDTKNGLVYLNRAVTEAEMTEFLASLQGDYQSVSVQNNPAERLHAVKNDKEVNFDKVFSDLRSAARLMPTMAHIYYNLGYMYTVKGDLPLAVENYTKAIELYQYFGEAYYNRGLVQLTLHEKEKGALDLSRAGELGIQNAYTAIDAILKD